MLRCARFLRGNVHLYARGRLVSGDSISSCKGGAIAMRCSYVFSPPILFLLAIDPTPLNAANDDSEEAEPCHATTLLI